MEAEATTVAAWQMAIKNRPLFHSLLFRSDRGVQYACSTFREQLEGMPVRQSMSRKGNCCDNAVAESFFKTMKTEMVYHHKFASRHGWLFLSISRVSTTGKGGIQPLAT